MFAHRSPRSCSPSEVSRPVRFGRGSSRAGVFRIFVSMVVIALPLVAQIVRAQESEQKKIIRNISIRGLQRESEQSLLAALQSILRVGSEYDREKVSQAAGQLYLTGKFKGRVEPEVVIRESAVDIIFNVEERPQVVQVRFSGRRALTQNHLTTAAPALRTRRNSLLSESYLLQDKEAIVAKYNEAGYMFATVETQVRTVANGVRVTFQINEGTRVRIHKISFVGNKAFSDSELAGIMSTREKGWFFGLLTPGFYDREILQGDLFQLENFYRQYGYFDVEAELDGIEFDDAMERLSVTILVREGQQYIFRGYEFAGNAVFASETLLGLTTARPGQPYQNDHVAKDREEILKYYGDRAYIEAKVDIEPVFSQTGNDVNVLFRIVENNEIYIEEVRIRGNVKTQDRVIRRELEFYPGERVDRSKVVESRSNLHRLQFFSTVNFNYEGGSSPGNRHVVVDVEETSTGRLILGFGVTSGFGVIGNFSITKRNFDITDFPDSFYDIPDSFTGAGQTLRIAAQPGTRRSLYRFSLTEPYLFDTRNSLTVSASALTIIRDDYDEKRATFAPRLAHAFGFDRDFVFSLGHRLEDVEIRNLDNDAPADAFAAKGNTTVVAVNTAVSYDKVLYEYLEGPYDGNNSELFYEYAGGELGGQVNFNKFETTNEFYYPLYTYQSGPETLHHVISLFTRFGWIEPTEGDDGVPIFERYFLGGPNNVRGFRFREMGPHDANDPIGGTAMLYANFEYSFPIFRKVLRGVAFFDYGNLATDMDAFTFDESRYVVGGGLRINFPFLGQPLPIGLYLGKALKSEDEDRERLFLFTIGTRF